MGRFINRDPIGYAGSPWNLYQYVGGGPSNALDPYGYSYFSFLAAFDKAVAKPLGGLWSSTKESANSLGNALTWSPPSHVKPPWRSIDDRPYTSPPLRTASGSFVLQARTNDDGATGTHGFMTRLSFQISPGNKGRVKEYEFVQVGRQSGLGWTWALEGHLNQGGHGWPGNTIYWQNSGFLAEWVDNKGNHIEIKPYQVGTATQPALMYDPPDMSHGETGTWEFITCVQCTQGKSKGQWLGCVTYGLRTALGDGLAGQFMFYHFVDPPKVTNATPPPAFVNALPAKFQK